MLSQEMLDKVDKLALVDKDGFVIMEQRFGDLENSGTQMILLQELEEDEMAMLANVSQFGMMKIAQVLVQRMSEKTGIPFPFLLAQLMGPIGCRKDEEDGE